jgi:hypothetical protein
MPVIEWNVFLKKLSNSHNGRIWSSIEKFWDLTKVLGIGLEFKRCLTTVKGFDSVNSWLSFISDWDQKDVTEMMNGCYVKTLQEPSAYLFALCLFEFVGRFWDKILK